MDTRWSWLCTFETCWTRPGRNMLVNMTFVLLYLLFLRQTLQNLDSHASLCQQHQGLQLWKMFPRINSGSYMMMTPHWMLLVCLWKPSPMQTLRQFRTWYQFRKTTLTCQRSQHQEDHLRHPTCGNQVSRDWKQHPQFPLQDVLLWAPRLWRKTLLYQGKWLLELRHPFSLCRRRNHFSRNCQLQDQFMHRRTRHVPTMQVFCCTRRTPSIQKPSVDFAAVLTSRLTQARPNVVVASPMNSQTTPSRFRIGLTKTWSTMPEFQDGVLHSLRTQMNFIYQIKTSSTRSGRQERGKTMRFIGHKRPPGQQVLPGPFWWARQFGQLPIAHGFGLRWPMWRRSFL